MLSIFIGVVKIERKKNYMVPIIVILVKTLGGPKSTTNNGGIFRTYKLTPAQQPPDYGH